MVGSVTTSVGSATNWLTRQLQSAGVSSGAAKTAAGDLLDAAATSFAAHPEESDSDFRAALDNRIDQDVSSGRLSEGDADKVRKALDEIASGSTEAGDDDDDSASSASSTGSAATGASRSGGMGGAGGGGGSSEKTEVSRATTVVGDTKTIVITYSDGTTTTETATATAIDHQKYDKHAAANDTMPDEDNATKLARDYLSQTPPGSLINKSA